MSANIYRTCCTHIPIFPYSIMFDQLSQNQNKILPCIGEILTCIGEILKCIGEILTCIGEILSFVYYNISILCVSVYSEGAILNMFLY